MVSISEGKVATDFGAYAEGQSVILQSDGKIIVAGRAALTAGSYDFALARYNVNGSLDGSFDNDGKASTDLGSQFDSAYSISLQDDGKIIVAGEVYDSGTYDIAISRYSINGTLDASFGVNGKVVTDLLVNISGLQGRGVVVQRNGKILVTGTSNADFALIRYNSDGSLDTSFDADGRVITNFGSGGDNAADVVIQSDDKVIVVGNAFENSQNFALVRYNPDGSLDTGFDTDGKVITSFGMRAEGRCVALQSDGKILVAGFVVVDAFNYDFALARYNSDGGLDTSFDVDGKVTTNFGTSDITYDSGDLGNSIAVQNDGKILVAGVSNNNFALVRYNANGSLDTTFDTDGKLVTDFGSSDSGNSVTIQSDGKILVAGYSGGAFALVRYNTNGSLDTSFSPVKTTETIGTLGNDLLTGGLGVSIDGLSGIDTVTYSGNRGPVAHNPNGTWTVGSDTLTNIERLQFSDKKVALDVTDNALETLQFIGVIAPSLQGNLNVRGTILSLFDQGKSMQEMSQLALDLGLITSDNTALAKQVFKNVFNTTADPDQNLTNTLVNFIEQNGEAKFLATVANLNINVDLVGLQQHGMEFV